MTDETKTAVEDSPEYRADLLNRASILGLTIHPNAKVETIRAKIAAKLAETPDAPINEAVGAPTGESFADVPPASKGKEIHPSKKLHRVIVTCNDPQKADQSGDVMSVSNRQVGNLRFYFHFNKPWHIPEIILETMKESKIFLHSSKKDGREIVTREVPRYNIQYLPALTDKERSRIADKQAAALATED